MSSQPTDPAGGDADAWERNARWWQDGFTEGADPEYEEQILPLAAECLAGARRVVDVGTGEGQVARHVALAVVREAERAGLAECKLEKPEEQMAAKQWAPHYVGYRRCP